MEDFNKKISSLIVFDGSGNKVRCEETNNGVLHGSKVGDTNMYIYEYGDALGLSTFIQNKAMNIHKLLRLKNIDGRNEHIMSLVSLYMASRLYLPDSNGLLYLFQTNDLTRFVITDFCQVYNQSISVYSKHYDINRDVLNKNLSFEVVNWSCIYHVYLQEPFLRTPKGDVLDKSRKFYWYLFVDLFSQFSVIQSIDNLVTLHLVYSNFSYFIRRKLLSQSLTPSKEKNYVDFFYKAFTDIYDKRYTSSDKIEKVMEYINVHDDWVYLRVMFAINAKLIGDNYTLTTVKYVNIYNLVKSEFPNSVIEMVLHNHEVFRTNIVSNSQQCEYIRSDFIKDLRVLEECGVLYNYVCQKIIETETKRLGEGFDKQVLLENQSFLKSISCCVLFTVLFTNADFRRLKIKKVISYCGVTFFEASKIIEIYLKELPFLNGSVKRYFKYVEQRIFSYFIWDDLKWWNNANTIDILRRKVYQIIYQRYNDLSSLFNLTAKEDIVNLFKLIYYCLNNDKLLLLFKNRHMDQIVMCGLYVYCNKVKDFSVQFKDIMLNYKYLCQNILSISPIEINKTLFAIPMNQDSDENNESESSSNGGTEDDFDDDEENYEKEGQPMPDKHNRVLKLKKKKRPKECDIVYFYNHIFVNYIKDVVFELNKIEIPKEMDLKHEESDNIIEMTPRRRRRLENTNFYISSRIISPHKLTPKTKKLYSFGKFTIIKEKDEELFSDSEESSSQSSSQYSTTSSESESESGVTDNGYDENTSSEDDDGLKKTGIAKKLFD